MTASMNNRIERSKLSLIALSAPRLKAEVVYQPVRPPLRATATIGEILAAKGEFIQ